MKSVSDDDILGSILMFPTFVMIFRFMRKNIRFILLAVVLYVLYMLFIFVLWLVDFGSFSKALDDFSIFVTSALNIGPPHDIFTILNFPFIFPPWDIPAPIFYGGIYYIFLSVAMTEFVSQKKLRVVFRKKSSWRTYLLQGSVLKSGLLHIFISLIAPVSNFLFFIIAIPFISWIVVPCCGIEPSGIDKYWILSLYFLTAFAQGACWGYLYGIQKRMEKQKRMPLEILDKSKIPMGKKIRQVTAHPWENNKNNRLQ